MRPTRRDAAVAWLAWAAREGCVVTPNRAEWSIWVQRHGQDGDPEPIGLVDQGRELKADILAVLTGDSDAE
jgi:hypothetical protein